MRKCHDFFVSDSYGNIPTTELFYQTMLTRIKPVGRAGVGESPSNYTGVAATPPATPTTLDYARLPGQSKTFEYSL